MFSTNAYIMLYELENAPFRQKPATVTINKLKNTSSASQSHSEQTFAASNGVTSDKVYGPELPAAFANKLPVTVNGIARNGNGKHSESSSSGESDHETSEKPNPDESKKPISNGTAGSKSPIKSNGSLNMPSINFSATDDKKPKLAIAYKQTPAAPSPGGATHESSKDVLKADFKVATQVMKLVPYDMDDSSDESSHSPAEAEPKATAGEWKVTPAHSVAEEPSSEGKSWDKKKAPPTGDRGTVNELLRMSHSGYGAPVSSWNGTRAQLDKEVGNERRENNRKRPLADGGEQGRVKHQKVNGNGSYKSNPGYNPIQVGWKNIKIYFLHRNSTFFRIYGVERSNGLNKTKMYHSFARFSLLNWAN